MVDIICRQRRKQSGDVNRFEFCALPDTGADVPMISEDLINKRGLNYTPRSSRVALSAANSSQMSNLGICKLWIKVKSNDVSWFVKFIVTTDTSQEIILSYNSLMELGLIPRDFPNPRVMRVAQCLFEQLKEELCEEFADCIGDDLPAKPMNVEPLDIVLKEREIHPSQCTKARPIEYHFQEKARNLLYMLLEAGIIVPEGKT